MLLRGPTVESRPDRAVWTVSVEDRGSRRRLWFSVPRAYGSWLSSRLDPAVIALFPVAMHAGVDLRAEGRVSARVLHVLRGDARELLRIQSPFFRDGFIEADEIVEAPSGGSAVATGFSAGVDSFAVLDRHLFREVEPGFRVTHLLFNNVGSHGVGGWGLFHRRFERLRPVAEETGLPFLPVDSNLDGFYPPAVSFQRSHSVRNAAVSHLLRPGIGRLLYAGSYRFRDCRVSEHVDSAVLDPILLPLLSVAGLDLVSTGGSSSRVEKTVRIAEWPIVRRHLNVCVNPHHEGPKPNCSACWKCLRTLATLEIAGLLEEFGEVFDLGVYRDCRDDFFRALPDADAPLLREVRDYAETVGFRY